MKFNKRNTFNYIAVVILVILCINQIECRGKSKLKSKKAKAKTQTKTSTTTETKVKTASKTTTGIKYTTWVRPLIKTARSYHSFANLPYCPGDVINQLSCPLCSDIMDFSFEVFKFYKKKVENYDFTFVLLFSDNRNEAVISFSGPRRADPTFYSSVYSRGFKHFGGEQVVVENTYLDVYNGEFRSKLKEVIQDYNSKFNVDVKNHKYTFVGHNFGGALATLAAYDLVHSEIIPSVASLQSPIVYSYGALRIGNNVFVNACNSLFKVVRIVKSDDVFPRLPSCTWSKSLNRFRCEEEVDFASDKTSTRPELLNYIQNYYGKNGGLQAGVEAPFRGNRMTFLEKEAEVTETKKQVGWAYNQNNAGYTTNTMGDPFDSYGKTNDDGKVSYSQPLGAEVLFSSNFKKHTICNYFYGVPNCEKAISSEFGQDAGKDYFNNDLTNC